MTTIKTITKLDPGMTGADKPVVHSTLRATPRNLLIAINALPAIRKHMVDCNGNLGCGTTSVWIDDRRVDGIIEQMCPIEKTSDAVDFLQKLTLGHVDRVLALDDEDCDL
jgi:hypothetical protein